MGLQSRAEVGSELPELLFSVVVPTCDRPVELMRCLEELRPERQSMSVPFEIIVTDDGKASVRDLVTLNHPSAKWTRGPQRGPAANRNHGVRASEGQWAVFVDDDCVPQENLLAAYSTAIAQNPDTRAFEGAILPNGDMNRDLAECPLNLSGGCFWSANVCIKRDLFDAVGGFDDEFALAAHEDQDLYIRIKPLTKVVFVPAARVVHPVRLVRLRDMLRNIDRRNVAWVQFATKNASKLNYRNRPAILAAGYYNHLRNGVFAFRHRYPKKFIYHALMLGIGLPMQGARLFFGPNLR